MIVRDWQKYLFGEQAEKSNKFNFWLQKEKEKMSEQSKEFHCTPAQAMTSPNGNLILAVWKWITKHIELAHNETNISFWEGDLNNQL